MHAQCYKCRHRDTKQEFAVKIVRKCKDRNELELLKRCQGHPNIVKLINSYEDDDYFYMVMELLTGDDLAFRLSECSMKESQVLRLMHQLTLATQFMHSKGVIHRDLKPENILFLNKRTDSTIKIIDFGCATLKSDNNNCGSIAGTLAYQAPEISSKTISTEASDMWSLGFIMLRMLCPSINRLNFDNHIDDIFSKVEGRLSYNGLMVLKALLEVYPENRMSTECLLKNAWFSEFSNDNRMNMSSQNAMSMDDNSSMEQVEMESEETENTEADNSDSQSDREVSEITRYFPPKSNVSDSPASPTLDYTTRFFEKQACTKRVKRRRCVNNEGPIVKRNRRK